MSFLGSFSSRSRAVATIATAAATVMWASACSDATISAASRFLEGTSTNHEIGVVVNSTGKALTLFQLGSPTTTEQVAFGASSDITPVGLSIRGRYAIVPLGNTASAAYVNLQAATVQRYFLFASGNATGSAFVNDSTILLANTNDNLLGRVTVGQASDSVRDVVSVPSGPTAIAVVGGHAFVVCGNLTGFPSTTNSILAEVDIATMQVVDTVSLGNNASAMAVGTDGQLYVINTGDYSSQSTMTIVNPSTMHVVQTVSNVGIGAGAISIDANGLAYISSFTTGTVIWNTVTQQFVRDANNPVCALAGGLCRGASATTTSANGTVYQLFFGDGTNPPETFVYSPTTYTLVDSISVGAGPQAIEVRTF